MCRVVPYTPVLKQRTPRVEFVKRPGSFVSDLIHAHNNNVIESD